MQRASVAATRLGGHQCGYKSSMPAATGVTTWVVDTTEAQSSAYLTNIVGDCILRIPATEAISAVCRACVLRPAYHLLGNRRQTRSSPQRSELPIIGATAEIALRVRALAVSSAGREVSDQMRESCSQFCPLMSLGAQFAEADASSHQQRDARLVSCILRTAMTVRRVE